MYADGILIDLGVAFFYNFILLIGIIVGCIIAANNKNGFPVFWIFFAVQLFSVIGIVIRMNRDGATTVLNLELFLFIILSVVGVCLIRAIRNKAAAREESKITQPEESAEMKENNKAEPESGAQTIICDSSQKENNEELSIPSTMMITPEPLQAEAFCRKCGAKIPLDSAFCPKCGERVIKT